MNEYYVMLSDRKPSEDAKYTCVWRFMATSDERARAIFNQWASDIDAKSLPLYSLVRSV